MINLEYIMKKPVDYSSELQRIIKWNALARGGSHCFSDETIKLQKKLVDEEVDEVIDALTSLDAVSVVSELCDLYIVDSYLHFLLSLGRSDTRMYQMHDLLDEWVDDVLTVDFKACLNAVITSNESKFTSIYNIAQEGCIEPYIRDMCKWIEESNEGRYKNVVGTIVNETHVVYRADGGGGKIVKPSHYIPHDLTPIVERALK